MKIVVNAKGQIKLPKEILDVANFKPGDQVDVRVFGTNGIAIDKSRTPETRKTRMRSSGHGHKR